MTDSCSSSRIERATLDKTGNDDVSIAVQTMKEGAQDFLVKGNYTKELLYRAIANAIEKVVLRRTIEEQRRELEVLAITDELTGLYNRRYFMSRLAQEITRVQRFETPLSVLMIDLDHFKYINDEHGHLLGDQVLIHVAGFMKSSLRGTDFAARYGGEEFCILALGTPGIGAEVFANQLRERIASTPCEITDHASIPITCSIGVAELTSKSQNAAQILALADHALYEAKHSGRNRVVRAS